MLIFTTDKPRLLRHFQKDPILFAYHIGDLDDFHFDYCQWTVLYHPDRAKIEETILTYTGCKIPSVLAFGVTGSFNGLLEETLDILPGKFHAHFQREHLSVFEKKYTLHPTGTHMKMKLENKTAYKKFLNDKYNIVQLNDSHISRLNEFYDRAYPDGYFTERMVQTGKYYGCIENNKIVAVSGVHVDSDENKITVLGSIATDPDFRGKGFSTAVTAKLLATYDLSERLVCLNVKADNIPAVRSYEKLGFVKTHDFEEACMELKQPVVNS